MRVILLLVSSAFLVCSASGQQQLSSRSRDPNVLLVLHFNRSLLESEFWAISDPSNSRYGQYYSTQKLRATFAATQSDRSAVTGALSRLPGVSDVYVTPYWNSITCVLPPSSRLALLERKLAGFPYELVYLIDGLENTNNKYTRHRLERRHSFPKPEAGALPIDPPLFQKLIGQRVAASPDPSFVQIVDEFTSEFSAADLQMAFRAWGVDPMYNVSKILGSDNPSQPGVEGPLDVQWIMAGTASSRGDPGAITWYFNANVGWLGWMVGMQEPLYDNVFVHSVSWYEPDSRALSARLQDALDDQFKLQALRGVSMLFCSGDGGLMCLSKTQLGATWPSNSAYVTSVGGWQLERDSTLVAWSASSGGFSDRQARPRYQDQVVPAYLRSQADRLPRAHFNRSNRGYPDISGPSSRCVLYDNGQRREVGGTSCATPAVASLISTLVTLRQRPLGFLNPWLYSLSAHAGVFLSVTAGSQQQQGQKQQGQQQQQGCGRGFPAAAPWNAVTGLGTPVFEELRKHLPKP